MPWDPVRDLLTMQERLESLFGRAAPGWAPPADLVEQPDRFVLTLELPGCRREDVRIDATGEMLTVTGLRPPSCTAEKYQQLERGQGPFSRSIRFSQPINPDEVTADLVDGVLTITLPKRQSATRIDVT